MKKNKKTEKKNYDEILSSWKKLYVCSCGYDSVDKSDFVIHQVLNKHRNGYIYISCGFSVASCAIYNSEV